MPPRRASGSVVAFCGTRGVPANYGGFETAVDEISKRLVRRGYECVIFCRRSSGGRLLKYHEGRSLVYVRGSSSPKLDTFVSALQTGWHLMRDRGSYDHVFWFNNANLPGILLTLIAGVPMSVNTDGMEWRRAKWGWPFKAYYLLASLLVSLLCPSVVTDSRAMESFYKRTFFKDTEFIPYGIPVTSACSSERRSSILKEYGLEPGRYFLQITRFEPDNLPLESAMAFRAARLEQAGFRFVIVGYRPGASYAERISAMSGTDGILVVSAIYDRQVLAVLRADCFCYIHGNSVGGTNPALLEAMSSCPRILAIDVPFSREVLGDTGQYFSPGRMRDSFVRILAYPDNSTAMRRRVTSLYQWNSVAESYMRLVEKQPAAYAPGKQAKCA